MFTHLSYQNHWHTVVHGIIILFIFVLLVVFCLLYLVALPLASSFCCLFYPLCMGHSFLLLFMSCNFFFLNGHFRLYVVGALDTGTFSPPPPGFVFVVVCFVFWLDYFSGLFPLLGKAFGVTPTGPSFG